MLIIPILKWALLTAEFVIALPILYLCVLSLSAILSSSRRNSNHHAPDEPLTWPDIGILVPAHNEEVLLGTLLDNLAELDYPKERYSIHVVADNCTDRTATLARQRPWVHVYERSDTSKRGKGYALNWLMQELEKQSTIHDAYIILDADSVVVPGLARAMAHELLNGAQAMQGHNTVLNTVDAPGTVLRWIALTLMNHVRPLGRNGIGASSTITGNGVCLSRSLLTRYPWQSYALSEDYQYYLSLVLKGERVRYVPAALVRSHMPITFAEMKTQDVRWEAQEQSGSKWHTAGKLILAGIQKRDAVRLEAVAELLTPPLSFLVGSSVLLCLAALALGIGLGVWLTIWLSLFCLAGLGAYIGTALYVLHPPRAAYRALLYAPGFMLWKLRVFFVLSRSKKHTSEWVRTSRPNSAAGQLD